MTERRRSRTAAPETPAENASVPVRERPGALSSRLAAPRTREEVEERYVVARDAWTAAMRQANTGRSADLAALAIAQEAYEAAAAERHRWISGEIVAIPIETNSQHDADLSTVVGQELAWRTVREHDDAPRGLMRLFRRRRKP
jgi:hypothetical protein